MADITIVRNSARISLANFPKLGSGSENISVAVSASGAYDTYTTELYYGWYQGSSMQKMLAQYQNGLYYIPSNALFNAGNVYLTLRLVSGGNKVSTNTIPITIEKSAVNNEYSILPATETWQNAVDYYINNANSLLNSRIDNLIISKGSDSSAEVIDARVGSYGDTFDTLRKRLENSFAVVKHDEIKAIDVNALLPNVVIRKNSKTSNTPFNGVSGNIVSFGNGEDNVFMLAVDQNGKAYLKRKWGSDVTDWKNIITSDNRSALIIEPKQLTPDDDLNNCKANRIYYNGSKVKNQPQGTSGGFCYTISPFEDGGMLIQYYVDVQNRMFRRVKQYGGGFTKWENEIVKDTNYFREYATLSLFDRVGVIGDSYASGCLYKSDGTSLGDHYKISWPQQLARRNGFTAVNYSQGGVNTREWLWSTTVHGLKLLNSDTACDLYILALGINDYYGLGESYLGAKSDIGTDNNTFYGNYAKIIKAVKEKAPNAKIVIATIANDNNLDIVTKFNTAIKDLASSFSIPCADIDNDPYFKSGVFKQMYGGHPTPAGYSSMATAYERVIMKCVYENVDYFLTGSYLDK